MRTCVCQEGAVSGDGGGSVGGRGTTYEYSWPPKTGSERATRRKLYISCSSGPFSSARRAACDVAVSESMFRLNVTRETRLARSGRRNVQRAF